MPIAFSQLDARDWQGMIIIEVQPHHNAIGPNFARTVRPGSWLCLPTQPMNASTSARTEASLRVSSARDDGVNAFFIRIVDYVELLQQQAVASRMHGRYVLTNL